MAFDLVYASELEQVLKESRGLLIDIRMREDYYRGHWPGAVNYRYEDIAAGMVRLPKRRRLILYCDHGGSSMQLAKELGQDGYQVSTVVGGYEAMKKVRENYFKNR